MNDTTKAVGKILEEGALTFKGDDAVEYFGQLVVAGLMVLRGARGDKFVDDFLLSALGDKSIISVKEATTN